MPSYSKMKGHLRERTIGSQHYIDYKFNRMKISGQDAPKCHEGCPFFEKNMCIAAEEATTVGSVCLSPIGGENSLPVQRRL